MGRFLQGVQKGFLAYADRRARTDQFNRLNAKSDEELKAMGLTRNEIARHVYRDIFFA